MQPAEKTAERREWLDDLARVLDDMEGSQFAFMKGRQRYQRGEGPPADTESLEWLGYMAERALPILEQIEVRRMLDVPEELDPEFR